MAGMGIRGRTAGFYKLTIIPAEQHAGARGAPRRHPRQETPVRRAGRTGFPYTGVVRRPDAGRGVAPDLSGQGKHTLRLTATRGQLVEPLAALDQAIDRMNKAYRDILVITGTTPDPYRDYYLEKEIPPCWTISPGAGIPCAPARCIEALTGGRRGSETSPIDEAVRTLDGLLENPISLPRG